MGEIFLMINIKDRIVKMNILKKYLKYYMDSLPYQSKDKALSLIQDIDNEINWFKLQKQILEARDNQLSLFSKNERL